MDQSYSESDISLSPSKILERLQVLRQLQLLQRGKLQKQHSDCHETTENSSSLTEIVSHFSNSTSYNTFRSLLETPDDSSNDATPRPHSRSLSPKLIQKDMIEGITVLNLSQESEFIVSSPMSTRSRVSVPSTTEERMSTATNDSDAKTGAKKQISLDEMPVLTPRKDFEALIIEKLKNEINKKVDVGPKQCAPAIKNRKPFLKRGEGTSRYGLQKKDLVIQNTKSLPWRQKSSKTNNQSMILSKEKKIKDKNFRKNNVDIQIIVTDHETTVPKDLLPKNTDKIENEKSKNTSNIDLTNNSSSSRSTETNLHSQLIELRQENNKELPKGKHPMLSNKGKTWASILNKEQNDFLCQLKQTDYYKNFVSPTKSTVSDISCDENLTKLRIERENAEQNMFELLERKVLHESFNLESSFYNRFLRRSQLECSGESTPLVMQQCLAKNPKLMSILPDAPTIHRKKRNEYSQSDTETNSEYTDCCSETCSSVSSCCSCKTVEESTNISYADKNRKKNGQTIKTRTSNKEKIVLAQKNTKSQGKEVDKPIDSEKNCDGVNNDSEMKANMVEMNAKLIATSELLKDRLRELEDEIETFRKENANLSKMREDIDAERHKFYEEKSLFEQKFNEEKILSEYYLADEKEKLNKQKQMYEKYVREMRTRLNKKDKDEVVNLKKEINDLREEIRLKDAKTTTTIARLRNQIKIMEKEKKGFQDEVEKLKKENRRIEHKNDMTRRMTNIKYLEEINKKLSNMNAKETQSEINFDNNAKYKAYEIERQSRPRKIETSSNRPMRTRAKSVPNLKVTSRYAKYFSQRDVLSDMERNRISDVESLGNYPCTISDNREILEDDLLHVENDSVQYTDSDNEDENNLEKLYMERFHSLSPTSERPNFSNPLYQNSAQTSNSQQNSDKFFISKSKSKTDSRISNHNSSSEPPSHRSRSPASVSSQRSSDQRSPSSSYQELHRNTRNSVDQMSNASHGSNRSHNLSKSPVSILTNRSSSSQKQTTVIHKDHFRDTFNVSPEPTLSKTSVSKTNLNPTEIKKPDGSKELRFPNGNVKFISSDGKYCKFVYYNGDVKENFYSEGRIKYFYADTKTCHTTHADGLEVLEFPDGQVEKRYKDGSSEIRLPNGSVRYHDPKSEHVREEWRFPDGTAITVSANGEQRIVFSNGQVEVHAEDHKRREFPDGTVKLVYKDGTSETRYASGRVRIKDKHGDLLMDSASR